MNDERMTLVQEFEEKILSIVSENLEVVTSMDFEIVVQEIATFSEEHQTEFLQDYVVANVEFAKPEFDYWLFLIPKNLAAMLASSMGGEEPEAEFQAEKHFEPLGELMNQILSPYLSELSSLKGEAVETIDTKLSLVDDQLEVGENPIVTQIKTTINSDQEFSFYKIVPANFPENLGKFADEEEREEDIDESPSVESPEEEIPEEKVDVDEARFQSFENREEKRANGANLNMLMDLEMPITIELGRTRLSVREVLNIGQGSIIELDKLSGDPVDVFINDRKFARGEVVVVDENFGVRITEILSPTEKLRSLQ